MITLKLANGREYNSEKNDGNEIYYFWKSQGNSIVRQPKKKEETQKEEKK